MLRASEAPPIFLMIKPRARPMAALAMFPGLSAPELQFILISFRIEPLTAIKGDHEPVLTSKVSKFTNQFF